MPNRIRKRLNLDPLAKLKYDSAGFSDGLPVTLRFADLVGEILTAGPDDKPSWLPFRHYIQGCAALSDFR